MHSKWHCPEIPLLGNTRQEINTDATCKPKSGPHFSIIQVDIELASGIYHKPHPFYNHLTQKIMACTTVNKGTSFTLTTHNKDKF